MLTSPVGVRILLEKLSNEHIDLRRLAHLKPAAVGRATARALEAAGLYAELVPESFTSAALAEELVRQVSGSERVLILRAEKGSGQLTDILSANGVAFDDFALYDTEAETVVKNVVSDYIVFASAFSAESFFVSGGRLSDSTTAVGIGEVTAAALRDRTGGRLIVAEESTAEGIVDIILKEEDK